MKYENVIICLLTVSLLLFIPACKSTNISPDNVEGLLLNYEGCKNTQAHTTADRRQPTGVVQECIQYQYDGSSKLLIKHINALFNCCPGEIKAGFEFTENMITIREWSTEHACRCKCHFDVNYQFSNINSGNLIIRIDCEGDRTREFTLNLDAAHSGSRCWDSPWPGSTGI